MNTDKLLARMTAQSSGPNPKEPGGGKTETATVAWQGQYQRFVNLTTEWGRSAA